MSVFITRVKRIYTKCTVHNVIALTTLGNQRERASGLAKSPMRSQGLDLDFLTNKQRLSLSNRRRKSQTPGNSPTLLDHSISISNCETCSMRKPQPDRPRGSKAAPSQSNVANKSRRNTNNNIGRKHEKHGSQAEVLKQRQQQQAVMTASGHAKATQSRRVR